MKTKKVIVTGGSKGIGKDIAKTLLKNGYSVHICARNEENLIRTARELSLLGKVDYNTLDVSNNESIQLFCENFTGSLYGLINNAAIFLMERIDENFEIWDKVIATNLSGIYQLTKKLLPMMVDGGRIINISSQLGKSGRAGAGAYCASKFGLIGLTKCWAKELGGRGITVNAICPGWIKTEMTDEEIQERSKKKNISPEQFLSEICSALELKRLNTTEEVAAMAYFLLSENASGITGQDFLFQSISVQE